MTLISYQQTLTLEIRGQTLQLVIPDYSEEGLTFRDLHLNRPGYEYEAVMAALLERLLRSLSSPVMLDLGAFIGYYSLLAGKLVGDQGRVYAIESNPRHVEVLKRNIALNALSNVEIVHTALSDRVETVRSIDNEVWAGTEGEGVQLQAETCDAMCTRLGISPNIAKMDVHGFEGKMLAGMEAILTGPLEYLMLELHPNVYLEKYTPGITRMMILDRLEAAGLHLYYVAGHRYTWSDGMRRFFETGNFAYVPLTRETRNLLLYDRHGYVFVLASRQPIEALLGPSTLDPSLE